MSLPDSPTPSRPSGFASLLPKFLRPSKSTNDPFEVRLSPTNSVDDEYVPLLVDQTMITVQTVSKRVFDVTKVAPTQKYNFFQRIGFGIKGAYLALKGKITTVSSEETRELTLYRANQELHSGITKVQKAFKNYTAAQTAVINNEKDAKVQAVRHEERQASTKLLASYNELIEKAISMTEGSGRILTSLDTEKLKEYVHDALDKGTENLIFRTINEVRAKTSIVSEINLGQTSKADQEKLQANYIDFVTQFSLHVQKALAMTGRNDAETVALITEAYIDGLASVPELGEKLNIIRFHGQLVELRKNSQLLVEKITEQGVKHFIDSLSTLINGEKKIERADLEQIQYQGIPLTAIKAFTDEEVTQLQNLQTLNNLEIGQRKDLKELESSLEGITASLAKPKEYSVAEIMEFLATDFERDDKKKDNNLLTAKKDSSLLTGPSGNKFQQLRQTAALVAEANREIAALEERNAATREDFDARIAEARQRCNVAAQAVAALEDDVAIKNREIGQLEADLTAFNAEVAKETKALDADKKTKLTYQFKIEGYAEKTSAESQRQLAVIQEKITVRNESQARLATLTKELEEARSAFAEVGSLADKDAEQTKAELEKLTLARTNLVESKIALSGNDIIALNDFLGVKKLPLLLDNALLIEANFVAGWLIDKRTTQEGSHQAGRTRDGINQLTAKRDSYLANIRYMKNQLNMFDEGNKDSLTFTPEAILGTEGAAKIQEQVHANLDVAKEVTYRVADRLVKGIKDELKRSAPEVKRAAARAAILEQTITLETKFGKLEKSDSDFFNQKIVDQVAQLQSMPIQTTVATALDCASELGTTELSDEDSDDDFVIVEKDNPTAVLLSTTSSTAPVVPDDLNNDNNAVGNNQVAFAADSQSGSPITPTKKAPLAGKVYIIDDMEL